MELWGKNILLLAALFMAMTVLSACSGMRPHRLPLASLRGVSGRFPIGYIIRVETGKAVSFEQLIDQLGHKDLIFIGEVHDNPEHHLIQVQILQALSARYNPMVLAMEPFRRTQQPIVDRYVKGAISETTFLKDLNWRKSWAFDFHYYRPLMLVAREKGLKVLAINAPKDLIKKVARSGLDSLDANERSQIADTIDLSRKGHRARLREVYGRHTHKDLKKFEYFYQAQCVWEDTMAESIAKYLRSHGEKMVVLTGNGHIVDKSGIPDRAVKRVLADLATIVLYPLTGQEIIEKGTADYIWLTGDYSRRRLIPPHGHVHMRQVNTVKNPGP